MKKVLLIFMALALFSGLALAEILNYTLPVPGVVWGSTAARARRAVEGMEGIASVKTSASDHTVKVQFDSERISLEDIIQSLNEVGYTVGEPVAFEPEG